MGFGVVGSSLARLVLKSGQELKKPLGSTPRLVAAVDSKGYAVDEQGLNIERLLIRKAKTGTVSTGQQGMSVEELIRNVEAEVLVEVSPTNVDTAEPATTYIKTALDSGKSVVTANKGPLALSFWLMVNYAARNNAQLRYSGAVGSGTPILEFGRLCAEWENITRFEGILNGTCNYVLSTMEKSDADFGSALSNAQTLGYAEANPILDVSGLDSACKLVIVSNHVLKTKFTLRDVVVKGVAAVTRAQVVSAKRRGKVIRLLASASRHLKVGPEELEADNPLAVTGPLNAVRFVCEHSGEKILVGKGAGGVETASAIVKDLIGVARDSKRINEQPYLVNESH